jgi:glycosyltransferase involved in cell wall biosynthesis
MFSNIPKNNLTIMGFVPELSDAAYGGILIVPILSGSGMRMKILDGAALSLPMITTSIGVEGLNFTNESSCLIADTATEFKKALTVLISDERKRKKIADNARQVFIKNYSKEALANKRNSIYNNLL